MRRAGTPLFATGSSDSLNGLIGGVQAGYNWQAGNWVAGVEADIQMSTQGATPTYVCPGAACNPTIVDFDAPVTATFDQGHKLDLFGTLRGRFGTTITPGCHRLRHRRPGGRFDQDHGAAVRHRLRRRRQSRRGQQRRQRADAEGGLDGRRRPRGRLFGNVTGKVEYLYMDFGNVSASINDPLNATPITLAFSSRITDNIVRAGVNYKFNPADGGL